MGSPVTIAQVNIPTGNLAYAMTDYQTSGANTLQFTRFYNSMDSAYNTLGVNWISNFDRSFIVNGTQQLVLQRPGGSYVMFNLSGGQWTTNADIDIKVISTGTAAATTWTLTDHDDNVEFYTGNPLQLASITARNGYKQTLTYNSSGKLANVTDSYGRALTFAYNGSGMLQSLLTPDGTTITYGYTAAGGANNLTSVTYPTVTPSTLTYLYDDPNLLFEKAGLPYALVGVIDENGNRYLSWTYDAYARVLTSTTGTGAHATSTATSYNDTTGGRTVTNALGVTDTYSFATLQTVPKVTGISRAGTATTAAATRSFAYDANGYMSRATDWNGNVTTYTNNGYGEPTAINEAVGAPVARTTSIAYDGTWVHLPGRIATPGVTASFVYDSFGEPLTETLTDTTTTTVPYSTNGQGRTWTNTWGNSLLTSVKTPNGNTTNLGYDSTAALISVTDPLGHITSVTAHMGGGLPLTVVDPNGVATHLTYDGRQRLLTSTLTTNVGPLTTKWTYDPAGNLVTTTLPDNSALTRTYDTVHRVTKITDLFHQNVNYTLDALGDPVQMNLTAVGNRIQRLHSDTFDALGRPIQDTGGMGQNTVYAYDLNGNALTITNPLSHQTQQTFDALDRPSQITDANSGVTLVVYDAHDRPLSVTDPNGNTTSYVYNGFGDLIEQVSPDSGTTIYAYDADANLTQKIDAANVVTNQTFDALDRPLTTTYPADATENVAYSYDQPGHGFGVGRLTSLTDAAGSLSRTFDERGNELSETRVNGPNTLVTSYGYDKASRIASITYPSGWTASYTRDIMGRVYQIPLTTPTGASAGNAISNATYEPFGPLYTLTYGNGVNESRRFDLDYRVTSLTDTGTNPIQNLAYSYDADDNVLSIADGVNSANSQGLGYDVLDRLTGATGSYGNLVYTYDPVGNRLSEMKGGATSLYSYTPHTNRLASVTAASNVQTFGYTATGNINSIASSTGPNLALGYNKANRYASEAGGLTAASYVYDAFGQRITKKVGGTINYFSYGKDQRLIEENDAGFGIDYVYLNSRVVAKFEPSTGSVYYLQDDRLGTPQIMTDGTQTVVWDTTYLPFGKTSSTKSYRSQNIRLPGQYSDTETGYSYNLYRDYVPEFGKYLETDPIGTYGGLNTYAYVNDNPEIHYDSTGLDIRIYGGGKMGQHEAIGVDTPFGTVTFGFGPNSWYGGFWGPGRIDENNGYGSTEGGNLLESYSLSNEDGLLVVKTLEDMRSNPPDYILIGYNCNTFANAVASYFSTGSRSWVGFSPLDWRPLISK